MQGCLAAQSRNLHFCFSLFCHNSVFTDENEYMASAALICVLVGTKATGLIHCCIFLFIRSSLNVSGTFRCKLQIIRGNIELSELSSRVHWP